MPHVRICAGGGATSIPTATRSADSAAGMMGRRKPPCQHILARRRKIPGVWGQSPEHNEVQRPLMRLADSYDIPDEVSRGPHSPAFEQFLRNWFGDTYALTHGELDLSFLDDLPPEELALARV